MGGATGPDPDGTHRPTFLSTRPVGGATLRIGDVLGLRTISIHAPRGGRDKRWIDLYGWTGYFYPRAPWGARLLNIIFCSLMLIISIHAPRGGRDVDTGSFVGHFVTFLSTRPVGGATGTLSEVRPPTLAISIHAPRGGRDQTRNRISGTQRISIHAPRGGRDEYITQGNEIEYDFYPRAPWGARRQPDNRPAILRFISIHAPRGGRDRLQYIIDDEKKDFYPRAPWGARRAPKSRRYIHKHISIHAPRGGRDFPAVLKFAQHLVFLSTRPVGGATV